VQDVSAVKQTFSQLYAYMLCFPHANLN